MAAKPPKFHPLIGQVHEQEEPVKAPEPSPEPPEDELGAEPRLKSYCALCDGIDGHRPECPTRVATPALDPVLVPPVPTWKRLAATVLRRIVKRLEDDS